MALTSMKTSEENDAPEAVRSNPYGYGLEIRLNEDQCEATGTTATLITAYY